MNVKIVYCVPCGYIGLATDLKKAIESKKDAKVILQGGAGGIMDIFVDGKLIFSKFKEGRKPQVDEILRMI